MVHGAFLAALLAVGGPTTGDRLDGYVLPVEPLQSDITVSALSAWAWDSGNTSRLLLKGDVAISVGAYSFSGAAAVVWIDRIASSRGTITQLAAWFDVLENPAERAGLGMSGRRVLVTASALGSVSLDVALLTRHEPPPSGLLDEAAARLAAYLSGLDAAPPALSGLPVLDPVPVPPVPLPVPGGPLLPQELAAEEPPAPPPPVEGPAPIFDPEGTVWFSFQEVAVTPGPDENVITATGSVVLHYVSDREGPWSQLTLSADRAVVFTEPGDLAAVLGGKLSAESVRGIYLEGNVIATAGDDEYTVRAPRIYYDLRADRAIMLDAVLRTYAREIGTTIYARAAEMRQLAANQWTAERAKVSTSEFFTPHFAVGAARVTVTERPQGPGSQETETFVESSHNTLEMGGVPFFYWPHASGRAEDEIPLRTIQAGYSNVNGAIIETSWNPFALLGLERPAGVDAQVHADGYTSRGAGGGIEATYERDAMRGAVDLYGLYDTGTDRTSSGLDVDPGSPWRGLALLEHQMDLSPSWSFQGQASYISDETFVTSWREFDFANRREYETAGYVNYQNDRSAFDALLKYNLNNFISNSYLLASRAFQVQKVPEFTYRRYGDSLFDFATYSGETSVSRVMFNFEAGTPNELGVPAAAFPFGIGANDSITAAFLAAGYPTEWVSRFDSRHELSAPVSLGSFHMAPYLVGRVTAWDNDFQAFSTEAERLRVFAAAGLRMSAEIQHVNDAVESRLWDLHRIRHILEPRATLWAGYSDVPDGSYPVYDETVESIGAAALAELGLRSTWQTKRGGPGRWRSVDFLTIDASAVFNSSEAFIESPTPHFYAYRPEYSRFGNHVEGSLVWMVSDTFSIASEANYDFDNSTLARFSIGGELEHTPQLSTFAEYRYIEADNNELLEIGWNYQLTKKYAVSLLPQWDFVAGQFRQITLLLERTFPDFKITLLLSRDEIADQTTIAATMDLVEF